MEPRDRRIAELIGEIDILQSELSACLRKLLGVVADYPAEDRRQAPDLPYLDERSYSVHWHGQTCLLGCTVSFRLMRRLSRRPNVFVSYDQLRDDVWRQYPCSEDTIRSEVRNLRQRLCAANMPDLAAAIRARKKHYVLEL